MSNNRRSAKKISPMAESIIASLEPLIVALDSNPNYLQTESTDTGHERPSTQDRGIQILLDSMIRPLHRQLYGGTNASGNKFNGAMAYMTEQETRMQEHRRKYEGREDDLTTDPATYRIAHYYTVAEARLNFIHDWYNAYCEAYQHVTGQQWKLVDLGNNSKAPVVDKDKAEGIKALFAKAGQRTLIKNAANATGYSKADVASKLRENAGDTTKS